ncbi:MAG: CaiB/BaiF CoA-transferase family protein [Dehalococcoidia bacterium]|nr:CoA transferase [Dehalococcoidia bacterium]
MDQLWLREALRVVELGSGISAAYGARLLADFGADVIKVEKPGGGDDARRAGPFPDDIPHVEKSGLFLYLNFNKRGIQLDVETSTGAILLSSLLADADVVIENLGPGKLDELQSMSGSWPDRLVLCSISHYGQDGPRADSMSSEIGAYASGGMMYITGDGSREPVKHGLHQAAHLAGTNAASAILAATLLSRHTGIGQRIDIAEQETVAQEVFPGLGIYSHNGGVMKRVPPTFNGLVASSPMETNDGYIMPSYAGLGEWQTVVAFLDTPELGEERFMTPEGRQAHGSEIDALLRPKFRMMSKHDLFHTGQEWGLTFTAVQTAEDLSNCPHLGERGFFIEQHHPVAGVVRMPGMVPFGSIVDRTPVRPAPTLGQHTAAVLEALGVDREDLPILAAAGII